MRFKPKIIIEKFMRTWGLGMHILIYERGYMGFAIRLGPFAIVFAIDDTQWPLK